LVKGKNRRGERNKKPVQGRSKVNGKDYLKKGRQSGIKKEKGIVSFGGERRAQHRSRKAAVDDQLHRKKVERGKGRRKKKRWSCTDLGDDEGNNENGTVDDANNTL